MIKGYIVPPFYLPPISKKKKSHIPHPYPHTPPPAPFISTTQSISSNLLIHMPPPSAPFISTNPFISPLLSTSSSPHPYPLPLPIYVCHILHPSQHPCYIRQRRSKPPSSKNVVLWLSSVSNKKNPCPTHCAFEKRRVLVNNM